MKTNNCGELNLNNLNEEITLSGWVSTVRDLGGILFIELRDRSGFFQLVANPQVNPEVHKIFEKVRSEYVIMVKGKVTKRPEETYNEKYPTGQVEMYPESVEILAESKVLPFVLGDENVSEDIRLKYRYLDIRNEKMLHNLKTRHNIVQAVRNYLNNQDFMEVETPMMQVIPGGAAARPFITHHNALDLDMYLRIAPELYLKRLVVGGFERVFEINRNFRNEGISVRHNPEFTMMELYMAYADYKDLIELTESLFRTLAQDILGKTEVTYGDVTLDFGKPFEKLTMREAIKKYRPETDMADLDNFDSAKAIAESIGIHVEKSWGLGRIVTEIFEEVAEAHLIQPTFITEYPAEVSPLARRNDVNPEITDRFEFFIGGREIGNGFSELNDAEDQAQRFLDQVAAKDAGDDEAMFYDEDYVTALEHGLPPTAGLGIGIDRMVMLFTNSHTIRDVILFPAMRPVK